MPRPACHRLLAVVICKMNQKCRDYYDEAFNWEFNILLRDPGNIMLTQSIVIPAKISFSHEWNIRNKQLPTELSIPSVLGFLFSGSRILCLMSVSPRGRGEMSKSNWIFISGQVEALLAVLNHLVQQFCVILATNTFMTRGHTTRPGQWRAQSCGPSQSSLSFICQLRRRGL